MKRLGRTGTAPRESRLRAPAPGRRSASERGAPFGEEAFGRCQRAGRLLPPRPVSLELLVRRERGSRGLVRSGSAGRVTDIDEMARAQNRCERFVRVGDGRPEKLARNL